MFNNKESNTYLLQILNKQNEILKELKDINNNIIKYCGEEYDLKEKELMQKIIDAKLTRKQFDVLNESINHVKEKYSKKDNKECDHEWVFNGSLSNSAGEHIYYKCIKCGATKLICNGVIYESGTEWQT